jgi:hypothetical protein
MTNIICHTQDIPGERKWINSNFPGFINLESESSGKWPAEVPSGKFIWEVPYSDPPNLEFIKKLDGVAIKTVYSNDADTIFLDSKFLERDQLLINNNIKFLNNQHDIKNYMMFTFARCGSAFTESLLQKKYPPARAKHYVLNSSDSKSEVVKTFCKDTSTLICLNYRTNWWSWLTSHALVIANKHLTERGVLHHFDNINWETDPCPTVIDEDFFNKYEFFLVNTFNFWIQLRVILPNHQFSLFRFEDLLPIYSTQTDHKKIPYDKHKLINNYNQTKKLFDEKYLPRWQAIETKALKILADLNVTPTTNI